MKPTMEQVPPGRLALWLLIASEIVLFGGLIGAYLLYRIRHPEWGAMADHTSTPLGALNTVFLLTSSLTVVLAHQAANHRDFSKAVKFLWITVAFGVGFLVVKSIEYTHEIHEGFTITGVHGAQYSQAAVDAGLFWSFYYVMTGLHALHVILGMIALATVAFIVRKGVHAEYVEMAGLYWHFVDVVWIFLFPLLYVAQ